MIIENWQNLVGVLALLGFSFIGMKLIEDKKLKFAAFSVGILTAGVLAGLDIEDLFNKAQSYVSEHADTAGIATSMTTMLLSALSPFKGLRNAGLAVGAVGVFTSMFGNPAWLGFLFWSVILTVLGIVTYVLVRKFVGLKFQNA